MVKEFPVRKRTNKSGTISYLVDEGVIEGKRKRKFFKTKDDAIAYARRQKSAYREKGSLALSLNPKQLIEATDCFALLAPFNCSLTEAVRYFIKHAQPSGGRKSVKEACAEFLETKERANKRLRYREELRYKFNRFTRDFGERLISEITAKDLNDWLYRQEFSPVTITNYRRDLGLLFRFAQDHGWCADNVAQKTTRPAITPTETEIFTPRQAFLLLAEAVSYRAHLVPFLTIGLFAGLRTSELERLNWEKIKLREGHIVIDAEKSKTSNRRTIQISENLRQWLTLYKSKNEEATRSGPIIEGSYYRQLEKLCAKAGIKWPKNGMRHSFASYHLAKHRNPHETMAELGHVSPTMIHRHYKALVSRENAALYWAIIPAGDEIHGIFGVAFDHKNKDIVALSPEKKAEAHTIAELVIQSISGNLQAA